MPQPKFKNIIFDFDGVIADTLPFAVESALEINRELKLLPSERVNPEELRSIDMHEFVKSFRLSKLQILFYLLKYRSKLSKKICETPVFQGIPEVLTELKIRNIKIGIATSNQKGLVLKFLKSHNIDNFDFIFSTIRLFHKEKLLNAAIKKYGLSRPETLYIGDEIRDITAARSAGIKIASVTWGFNFESVLTEHKPDFIIYRPSELLDLVLDTEHNHN